MRTRRSRSTRFRRRKRFPRRFKKKRGFRKGKSLARKVVNIVENKIASDHVFVATDGHRFTAARAQQTVALINGSIVHDPFTLDAISASLGGNTVTTDNKEETTKFFVRKWTYTIRLKNPTNVNIFVRLFKNYARQDIPSPQYARTALGTYASLTAVLGSNVSGEVKLNQIYVGEDEGNSAVHVITAPLQVANPYTSMTSSTIGWLPYYNPRWTSMFRIKMGKPFVLKPGGIKILTVKLKKHKFYKRERWQAQGGPLGDNQSASYCNLHQMRGFSNMGLILSGDIAEIKAGATGANEVYTTDCALDILTTQRVHYGWFNDRFMSAITGDNFRGSVAAADVLTTTTYPANVGVAELEA